MTTHMAFLKNLMSVGNQGEIVIGTTVGACVGKPGMSPGLSKA
jgi:hypothetical protein